tara:strand:- start:140 stop:517 length:378 start_codon:yes stop_codon:yes gene_type:complete
MSKLFKRGISITFAAVTIVSGDLTAFAADDTQLQIIELLSDKKIDVYVDDLSDWKEVEISAFTLPLSVLETDDTNRFFKVGKDQWLHKYQIRLNEEAQLTSSDIILENKSGGAADENSNSSRGLK